MGTDGSSVRAIIRAAVATLHMGPDLMMLLIAAGSNDDW